MKSFSVSQIDNGFIFSAGSKIVFCESLLSILELIVKQEFNLNDNLEKLERDERDLKKIVKKTFSVELAEIAEPATPEEEKEFWGTPDGKEPAF